jgi:MFS family permease
MTNALMVVAFQVYVTNRAKQYRPGWVMAMGTFLYAIAVTSIALGTGFWSFWMSMVILTCGELLLVPTATSVAANLAPVNMRGRYMGFYSLSWQVAFGIGPVLGGILNDQISPQAIWYGGGVVGLIATLNFIRMANSQKHRSNLVKAD